MIIGSVQFTRSIKYFILSNHLVKSLLTTLRARKRTVIVTLVFKKVDSTNK